MSEKTWFERMQATVGQLSEEKRLEHADQVLGYILDYVRHSPEEKAFRELKRCINGMVKRSLFEGRMQGFEYGMRSAIGSIRIWQQEEGFDDPELFCKRSEEYSAYWMDLQRQDFEQEMAAFEMEMKATRVD